MHPLSRIKHIALAAVLAMGVASTALAADAKATIILVHGAFADTSSWQGVIPQLQADGYSVIAAANPLRSLKGDADYISAVIKSVKGKVVLVGHSYGGSVITNAANDNANVAALVYVAGLAPDQGESAFDLVGKFPGSTLGAALAPPIPLAAGVNDLYLQADKFKDPYAADVADDIVTRMAVEQRPVTDAALQDSSGAPAWKDIPSWFVYGDADLSVPPAAHAFMAQRVGAKETVIVPGASHAIMVSHADAVVKIIEEAAAAVAE